MTAKYRNHHPGSRFLTGLNFLKKPRRLMKVLSIRSKVRQRKMEKEFGMLDTPPTTIWRLDPSTHAYWIHPDPINSWLAMNMASCRDITSTHQHRHPTCRSAKAVRISGGRDSNSSEGMLFSPMPSEPPSWQK